MQPNLAHALAETLVDGGWRAKARPEQLPPLGDWLGWLILSGRGWGKTRTGAEWIHELAASGSTGRIGLIAPTAADVRDVMVEGPSGVLTTAPSWNRPTYEPSKRRLTWPNGAIATTFSSEEADRLRGPEHDAVWCDELAAWADAQAAWDMAMFGLRIGSRPRWLVTTTPKPIKLLKHLLGREGRDVVVVRGSTFDNRANLSAAALAALKERYEGTRLGRQELMGEYLSDTPGALWQMARIDECRIEQTRVPDLKRIVVAIDPAVSNNEGSDETGIVVAGVSFDGRGYVLEDLSGRYGPHEMAVKAIDAFNRHRADRVIAEINNGGQLVEHTLRMVNRHIPFKAVHASRAKVTRAEPISALYEQRKVSHVGSFPELEDQLCAFTSDFDRARAGYSPDRLDALVWALSELLVQPQAPQLIIINNGI